MDEAFGLLSSECEPEEDDYEACAGDEACAARAEVGAAFPRHLWWLVSGGGLWIVEEESEEFIYLLYCFADWFGFLL